jgi:hypothetical protein
MLLESRTDTAPAIRLDVPPDFHQIPLEPQVERRTAAQLKVVSALGLSSSSQREAISLYLEALSIRLAEGNVVGTAFCAVQLAGRPSSATLTVAVHETHTADASLAVLGAAEAMRRAGRYDQVEILAVCGRAVVSAVAERAVRPGETPTGQAGSTLREISVLVPVAGQQHAVMLTLSTPNLDDWETYRAVVLDICRSVRMEQPRPRS